MILLGLLTHKGVRIWLQILQNVHYQIYIIEILNIILIYRLHLYTLIKELEAHKREATDSMGIVDRVDYEIEVEEGEEHELSLDRDPRGLAYALAARHGDIRVKDLLEELSPGFGFLKGCDMSEPLYRDVAKFVLQHAIDNPEAEISAMTEAEPVATNGRAQNGTSTAVQDHEE